jgi:hypothetical protein
MTMDYEGPLEDKELLENVVIFAFDLFGTLSDNEDTWGRRFWF